MTRTLGAAIGAVIVFLFFVFGISHPRTPAAAPDVAARAFTPDVDRR